MSICIPFNIKMQFKIIYKEICTVWYEHGNSQGFNKWFVCASASASSSHRNILHELSCTWRRYRPYCMLHQHLWKVPPCLLWQLKYHFRRIKILQVHENAPETKCSCNWSCLPLPWRGVPRLAVHVQKCLVGKHLPPTSASLHMEPLLSLHRGPDPLSLL